MAMTTRKRASEFFPARGFGKSGAPFFFASSAADGADVPIDFHVLIGSSPAAK
jgi:hypothetical protein